MRIKDYLLDPPEADEPISELVCECGSSDWELDKHGLVICAVCSEFKPCETSDPIPFG